MHTKDAFIISNALNRQELYLRDAKISKCSDLAGLCDSCDFIDLTNNELRDLTVDFPEMSNLSGLLLAHNKIALIEEDLGLRLPRLEMLSLSFNALTDVNQLSFLKQMPKLQHLCLSDNPVVKTPDYRDRVVALQPSIRILDFERVREVDRKRAINTFGTAEATIAEPLELQTKREELLSRLEKATDLAEINLIDKQLAALH